MLEFECYSSKYSTAAVAGSVSDSPVVFKGTTKTDLSAVSLNRCSVCTCHQMYTRILSSENTL